MKKKEIVIGVSVLISASLPISVYAASNESMSSRGFIIDETNEFEDIVKQILDVKSKHPEWSELQIMLKRNASSATAELLFHF